MADRYNVRNVAQKEIYDSYMGILRISPNTYHSKDQDDPTLILETLVDINHAFQGESSDDPEETKIILSDSDGNKLPIVFVPKAFNTNILVKKPQSGAEGREYKDIVNLTTFSETDILVSNKFTARSTITLTAPEKKVSKLMIISGCSPSTLEQTVEAENILIYPIENPNDDHFFNYRNEQKLFDPSITDKPRHEQMEEELMKWSLDDYKNMISYHSDRIKSMYSSYKSSSDAQKKEYANNGEDPQVKINGKYINTFNNDNEEIPILYTRDYILGHYDGHSLQRNYYKTVKDAWCHDNKPSEGAITKLSWIRFDNLVWEALDEVLSGKVRHQTGRYDMLGESGKDNYSIKDDIFSTGECTLSSSENSYLQDTAPLLGKGMQEGIIMYHAMPFHRYWFHRCRQIIYNMERWVKLHQNTWGNNQTDWSKYNNSNISADVHEIQAAHTKGIITPCCKASITPHHSLAKNFLLCNGDEVSFRNFPNINLSNYNILKIDKPGKEAEVEKTTNSSTRFPERTADSYGDSDSWENGTFHALVETSKTLNGKIKLPNLYSFTEAYPRFIRSFNWQISGETEDSTVSFNEKKCFTDVLKQPNVDSDYKSGWDYKLHSKNMVDDEGNVVGVNPTDVNGKVGIDIQKPFTEYGLYYFNYEYLTPVENHTHKLWSSNMAINGKNNNFSKNLMQVHEYGGTKPRIFHGKSTYDNKTSGALTNNYRQPTSKPSDNSDYADQWFNYCINLTGERAHFFHNFTPIPNLGLMLWNSSIYNTGAVSGSQYKGTLKVVEDGSSSHGYIDGQGVKVVMNGDYKLSETLYGYSMGTTDETNFVKLNKVRTQRFKRRQQAVKLNEAEGRIPISYFGTGQYTIYTRHVFLRKRSWGSRLCGNKWDKEYGDLLIRNVAGYKFGSSTLVESKDNAEIKVEWSCLTSLPYEKPEYLGHGDTTAISDEYLDLNYNSKNKKTKPHDYYINHNVTDKWKPSVVIRTTDVKHGGVTIKSNIESPYPSYMNLLPLIRL